MTAPTDWPAVTTPVPLCDEGGPSDARDFLGDLGDQHDRSRQLARRIAVAQLLALDDDNAALVYTGTAYRDGDAPAFVGAMSSVYHRVDGVWKLTLYQQTRKPDQ